LNIVTTRGGGVKVVLTGIPVLIHKRIGELGPILIVKEGGPVGGPMREDGDGTGGKRPLDARRRIQALHLDLKAALFAPPMIILDAWLCLHD
jgi:hypothetical protein